jgi:hypothetical protein
MPVTALRILVLATRRTYHPPKRRDGAVNSTDQNVTSTDPKKQARTIVSERLRLFFSQLREQLASSTDDLWKRVETQISGGKKEP